MRRRRHNLALIALLAIAVLFPGTAFASKTEVQKLQDQLRALEKDFKRAGDAYSKAYWQLDATKADLAKTDREIEASRARLAEVNGRLSERIVELYRTGGIDYVSLLLGSDDLDTMLVRMEYAQRIGEQDAGIIAEVRAISEELALKRAHLEEAKAVQAEEATQLKQDADKLQKQLKAKQAEYDALRKKLDAAVAAERSSTGRTTYRAGPNGMVFPVRGPNYYSDTWGAARSGGRTHKGTDIMAARGVPCVAVLSGTVRSRESSLGGKTIWLTADNGWAFYYAHLNSYSRTSGRVQAGEVIGTVGDTGNARGGSPHLHFEIHPSGRGAVNPYPYLRQMQ